jgi:outer membrane immunogenic protein
MAGKTQSRAIRILQPVIPVVFLVCASRAHFSGPIEFTSWGLAMKAKLIVLLSGALSLGAVATASAADMAVKAPPPAPIAVANWTGFYIGGEVGGRWTEADWNTTCLGPGAFPCTPTAFPTRFPFNNPSSFDSSGVVGGVYGGYNWQMSNWVFGVEGDFRWGDNKRTKAGIPGAEDPAVVGSPGLDSSSVRQTWEASARGRLGILVTPSVLLFGTGGVAFTHVESTAACGTVAFPVGWCAFPNRISTGSDDLVGWTVGAGIEAMVASNWLVRGEYRYADYGTFSSTVLRGPGAVLVDAVAFDTKIRTHSAMVGIAYKFGGPVVARY